MQACLMYVRMRRACVVLQDAADAAVVVAVCVCVFVATRVLETLKSPRFFRAPHSVAHSVAASLPQRVGGVLFQARVCALRPQQQEGPREAW